MSHTICFISKDGGIGTCAIECLSEKQVIEEMGSGVISCSKCSFYRKYKGKEKENFTYTEWMGKIEGKEVLSK